MMSVRHTAYPSRFKLFAFGLKLLRELEQWRLGLNFRRLVGIITNIIKISIKYKNTPKLEDKPVFIRVPIILQI